MNTRQDIDAIRTKLPEAPGVYVYHDISQEVLYVGKAKNLKKRVNSYFTKSHDAKTQALVMRIDSIEVFEVSSEQEALQFERELIQRYKPRFNVMLRDDKSYPWIAVTTQDEYPRVIFTRERRRKGTKYFGPYSSAKKVRESLDLLNRIFPYRPCEGEKPGRQSGTPCLDFHIERCAAPCINNISKDEYANIINQVMCVLDGNIAPVQEALEHQMRTASQNLEFEAAARARNRLEYLQQISALQQAERPTEGSYDVVGIAMPDAQGSNVLQASVQLLLVRDGVLADRRSYTMDIVEGHTASTVLAQFILSYYTENAKLPRQIITNHEMEPSDLACIDSVITQGQTATRIVQPQRGDKKRLSDLAQRNAQHALTFDSLRSKNTREKQAKALETLREALQLESLPLRIECYDISNLQDEAPVASMVVFEEGKPKKDHYRKFSMRHEHGQDDFAMMKEVITRRLNYLVDHEDDATVVKDESFQSIPNLIVIDGGKGQLGKAVEAMREVGVERISLCSLAKKEELIYLPNTELPVVLSRSSPAMHVMQAIRDEAHRFALGYHRKKRSEDAHVSILDALTGVGPARKRALLNFFGSPERVQEASIDELEAVPGLPWKTARAIYDQLHRFRSHNRNLRQ